MNLRTRGTILIVEGDRELRKSLAEALKNDGYAVAESYTPEEVFGVAKIGSADVILLGQLPAVRMMEMLQRIRKLSSMIKVIVMTGHASLADAITAIKEEVSDFLIMPIDFNQLSHSIEKALVKLSQEREKNGLLSLVRKTSRGNRAQDC